MRQLYSGHWYAHFDCRRQQACTVFISVIFASLSSIFAIWRQILHMWVYHLITNVAFLSDPSIRRVALFLA